MKASVREGGTRRLHVASNLEFLKVGRTLQLEGTSGERRPAKIHAVDVMVDPSTQVPQLVVSLKFQDVDEVTPEPSVIDSIASDTPRSPQLPLHTAVAAMEAGEASTEEDFDFDEPGPEPGEAPAEFAHGEDEDEDEIVDDAGRFSTRMSRAATVAGVQAKRAGETFAQYGAVAAKGMGRLFKGASAKVGEYRKTRSEEKPRPRRTTAPPPSGALSANGRKLRRQSESDAPADAPKPSKIGGMLKSKKSKKIAGAAALALLVTTVSVIAMKKPASPPGADADLVAASKTVAADTPKGDVTQVDEQGNPVAAQLAPAAPAAPAPLGEEPSGQTGGVSADVPLFGPTPMATMEPAPLGPPPELGAPGEATEQSEEEQEKAAAGAAEDEKFEDKEAAPKKAQKANPSSVRPWGKGRINKPTIHRLRLDQPGGAIKGAINPTGFTVVVPGVKVMESARGIQKRDARIARVRTRNGSYGAEVTFQFRNSVPGYRVRLRKDYVEFLISEPDSGEVSRSKSKSKSK
ncbi:MAG TPA: hypothetical protein PKA88_29960, partial [Polyangiaceae bacterium]|nr:hypothetical protein [Polyangiaceae bacterium]